ncbi:3-phenylpropionate/cinnamic acid dioxygenase subunit beta [Sulfolobus tengchongensis]|uniref:3-phenylpropionate/cinnamic acid dioxygenase subunit beta n=1 Tax=Sulfolobus tengchongensis TaxID=207809 RepID=A0AAX4L1I7_9CREN
MNKVKISSDLYMEIVNFLNYEAELLDNHNFKEWANLLADDIEYIAPVRYTADRLFGNGISYDTYIFRENKDTILTRIAKLEHEASWANRYPSRTRRYVTNIRVEMSEKENEFLVKSNVLIYRSDGDLSEIAIISAERKDVLRKVNNEFKIAKRLIIFDNSTIPTHDLYFFV